MASIGAWRNNEGCDSSQVAEFFQLDEAAMKTGKGTDTATTLNEMMARLPAARRRRIEARAAKRIAEELALRDLRKARGKTQVARRRRKRAASAA